MLMYIFDVDNFWTHMNAVSQIFSTFAKNVKTIKSKQ